MIENILIKGIASYSEQGQSLDGLSNNNFIYGANGSGKTTISRLIADQDSYPGCSVIWKGGSRLEPLVYNRDFVDKNFNASSELKGIFTLGEKDDSIIKSIEQAKIELDQISEDIQGKKKTLSGEDGISGKNGELKNLEDEFVEQCWDLKNKYDQDFKSAFKGVRDKKVNFKARFVTEAEKNGSPLLSLEELKEKAETIFSDNLEKETIIPKLLFSDLVDLEKLEILTKKVIGKEDVDIASMIKRLGNSDWVKEGRVYYDQNDGYCPFCQQTTEHSFTESLNQYFDETYINDIEAINNLATNYEGNSNTILQRLTSIIEASPKYLDCELLQTQKDLVEAKINANMQHIERKKKEASTVIKLDPLGELLKEINDEIEQANHKIIEHNKTVDNIEQEKRNLTSSIWRFVVEEVKLGYEKYITDKGNLDKAITGLQTGLEKKEEEKREKERKIKLLEKDITSIQPTIDEINSLLSSFGFSGFSLAKSDKEGFYKIIRPDGGEAKQTLSEGEKTFVTFLYFYHLLKGSNTESGITADRVVVFDDPVSSLDSDILFIVSHLIKGLFEEIRAGTGYIKQIFVMTHNVYFHKEITFNKNRSNGAMNEETFWVVKKTDNYSVLQRHDDNPVMTSYELLWNEVRDENRSTLTIQNTLRRILENYFKILGNINNDEIINKFQGKEKLICGSLFSWVNDGSHFANDDLYLSCDASTVDSYLDVFKKIFEKTGHIAHYNMMMGIPSGQDNPQMADDNTVTMSEVAT